MREMQKFGLVLFSKDARIRRKNRKVNMGVKESNIIKLIQLKFSKLKWRLFRNQTGTGWQGKAQRIGKRDFYELQPGDVIVRAARYITFGLTVGSHDMIGWRPLLITQEMVGTTIAQFTSMEVKTENLKPTPEQIIWRDNVNQAGGHAKIVYSVDEVE